MRAIRNAAIGFPAAIILAALLAAPAAAQPSRPWRAPAGSLDLTDEQLERIEGLRLAFREEILPLEMKWMKLDLELESMDRKGQDPEAKLKELDALELELDKLWDAHQGKVRSVLTDDQKILFDRYGGLGLGPGWGAGRGRRLAPRLSLRAAAGPGMGYGRGAAEGRHYRGYGRSPRYGRGYGPGLGRGYFCPWRRW